MGKRAVITILDSVHCKANKEAREIILPALAYKSQAWQKGEYGQRTQVDQTSHLITGRTGTAGTFLSGLLPRVMTYCKKKGKKVKINGYENIEVIEATKKPKIKGITFRPDQVLALKKVKKYNRGKIIFPTGSGKTAIACGMISMYPELRVLFLCHTKDLINQSKEAFNKHLPKRKVFIIGGGHKTDIKTIKKVENPIVVATIQSFSNIPSSHYADYFDMTIVDEAHHVNSRGSRYGKVMENNLSPLKYALTATQPTKAYEILVNEGIFGKVIAELTIDEGVKTGIIAKPKINLVPVAYETKVNQKCERKYKLYYEFGIVKNRTRNLSIVKEVKKRIKKNKTSLIIIERTEHGEIIQKMLKSHNITAPFVHGGTPTNERNKVKRQIKIKKTKVVICSKVWKEGVNIPSLNHIVIAHGMKEEKMVLQALGRGLRTTKKKKVIIITDFMDPYHYLAEHSIMRMSIYVAQGWI